jgi:hypothetical protein
MGLFLSLPLLAGEGVRNGDVHDGRAVDCDVPESLRVRNTVGTNGMGLCVWASTQMMSNYLNTEELAGLFRFMQTQPGGGWPERVDEVMAKFAPDRKYRQYLGPDLAFVQEGIDSGRPVAVTYGYGELYGNQTIAHMVLCVALDSERAAILDNNDPGHIWWMPREEFKRRFGWPRGAGWAWYILAPPPPPVPHN